MALSFIAQWIDRASQLLGRVQEPLLNDRERNTVAGRACQNELRQHFFYQEKQYPNEMGWPRQHFWAAAARSLSFKVLAAYAVISVNQVGVRQQWQGGTILPRNGTYLTIPARAEAYGKRAREFDLKFGYAPDGVSGAPRPALLAQGATGKDGGEVYFWLVRRVRQVGRGSIMPSDARFQEVAIAAIQKLVAMRKQQPGAGAA